MLHHNSEENGTNQINELLRTELLILWLVGDKNLI